MGSETLGSEMGKRQDPGSGKKSFRIRNTGPRTLLESLMLTCMKGADVEQVEERRLPELRAEASGQGGGGAGEEQVGGAGQEQEEEGQARRHGKLFIYS
jgi:hypothetical protein